MKKPRADTSGPFQAGWLSQLLEYSESAPLTAGQEPALAHFLEHARLLLPGACVGVCLVRAQEEPLTLLQVPEDLPLQGERDPTRLFPSLASETILPLDEAGEGSTLHVAWRTQEQAGAQQQKAERCGQALRRVLQRVVEAPMKDNAVVPEQVRARLVQIEKLASMGQIVAGVVHELNNPLTSIIAYSDYLKKRTAKRLANGDDVGDDLERLGRIGEAAERILRFSRDLVSYARPATNVPGPVYLPDVIEKAIVFCEHDFGKHGITVERGLEGYLPPVRGVAGQLMQVFINLFTNAVHAMKDAGGALTVSARQEDAVVVVEVGDSGMGISTADLKQIFEPFFTTKLEGRGTGLGLSIVRDIVQQHGGELLVSSVVGQGSVFTLQLPTVALPRSLQPPVVHTAGSPQAAASPQAPRGSDSRSELAAASDGRETGDS